MVEITRRALLGTAAAAGGVAAVAALMPEAVENLVKHPVPTGQPLSQIKHVVLLMQKNRSFDHYFGMLPGVRGFNDPAALTLTGGRSVFHQPDPQNPDGYLLPFHLDTQHTSAQRIPSTSHAWDVQHNAWNNGAMDSWLPAHQSADGKNAPYVMGYYTRDDIPFHYALADAFTVCDGYHSSLMGPTWPPAPVGPPVREGRRQRRASHGLVDHP